MKMKYEQKKLTFSYTKFKNESHEYLGKKGIALLMSNKHIN